MRVLARSVADSARIGSADSPVRDEQTRAQLAAVLGELSAAVRAYGQLVEAGTPAAVLTGGTTLRIPPVRGDSTGPMRALRRRVRIRRSRWPHGVRPGRR